MHQEDVALGPLHVVKPLQQLAVVGVAGEGVQDLNARMHLKFIAEDVHVLAPFAQLPAQRVLRAVAYKEDDVVRVADVVAQVVQDASCFRHAGGGDDHRSPLELVQVLRLVHITHQLQPFKAEGVRAHECGLPHAGLQLIHMQAEDLRGLHRQRAVHKGGDQRKAALMAQLVQRVEQLLGALHRKGGDDQLPLLLQHAADDLADVLIGIRGLLMVPPAIGAFHDDVVHLFAGLGCAEQVVVWPADVAGEEQAGSFSCLAVIDVQDDLC